MGRNASDNEAMDHRNGSAQPVRTQSSPARGLGAGFSLIELLVVVAIIVILTTVYLNSGSRAFQARKRLECERNLRSIYVALKTYSLDGKGFPDLPSAKTSEAVLSLLIPKYTTGTEFFICPGTKDAALPEAEPFANRRISYAYYQGQKSDSEASAPLLTDRQVNTRPKVVGDPLFSEDGRAPGNNHNKFGGNILFCDGNVQASEMRSAFALTNAPNVTQLNPKP